VVGAALVAGALIEEWVRLAAQNHPWRVGIVGGTALVAIGVVLLVVPGRAFTAAAALLLGAFGFGLVAGLDDRDHELGYYCRYGARSDAELDDCMKRVNTDEIAKLDTPAARFARGETSVCGRGSGPYCPAAARENATE
jgi:hypothetical protein